MIAFNKAMVIILSFCRIWIVLWKLFVGCNNILSCTGTCALWVGECSDGKIVMVQVMNSTSYACVVRLETMYSHSITPCRLSSRELKHIDLVVNDSLIFCSMRHRADRYTCAVTAPRNNYKKNCYIYTYYCR